MTKIHNNHRQSVVDAHLKEPWEHVSWLAPDDKKARVELPKAGIKILQTLEEKPEEKKTKKAEDKKCTLLLIF